MQGDKLPARILYQPQKNDKKMQKGGDYAKMRSNFISILIVASNDSTRSLSMASSSRFVSGSR